MRFFLELSYDGTNYSGWQRQPQHPTIQQELEDCLIKLFPDLSYCHGCGRTDAGVHARQFFAHIDLDNQPSFDLVYRLNKMLPSDISVLRLIPVGPNAHAQFDATSRTYEYHLHTQKNPFYSRFSTLCELSPDRLQKMEEASGLILNHNDFKMLCRQPDSYKHTRCDIKDVIWQISDSGDRATLRIKANRFLRGMIRLLLARMIEVAKGEITMDEWEGMLSGKLEMKYKEAAYPQGLHLVEVSYPYLQPEMSI